MSYDFINIEDAALKEYLSDTLKLIQNDKLAKLLTLIIDRLIETSNKFNVHQHYVKINPNGNEYVSDNSGVTDEPCKRGPYGCNDIIKIGG